MELLNQMVNVVNFLRNYPIVFAIMFFIIWLSILAFPIAKEKIDVSELMDMIKS